MAQNDRTAASFISCPDLKDPRARLFKSHQDDHLAHARDIEQWWPGQRPDLAGEALTMASRAGLRAIAEEVMRTFPGAETMRLSTDGGLRLGDVLDGDGKSLAGGCDPEVWDRVCRAAEQCLGAWTGDREKEAGFGVTEWGDWLVPVHGNYETKRVP